MKRFALPGIAAACTLAIASVNAKPLTIELPADSVTFKPGPNLEAAQGNCGACHSADYIQTQPRDVKDKKAFWQVEVNKMINLYGAPIAKEDVPKIVDYLSATY